MNEPRPTHTFHRIPSDTYNLTQLRSPSLSQPDQSPAQPDYSYVSPASQPYEGTSDLSQSYPIALTGTYFPLPLPDADSGAQTTGIHHVSYASVQSVDSAYTQESAQSQDRLLGNPRDSGRLQAAGQPGYFDPGTMIQTKSNRSKWINSSWVMYFFLILGIAGAGGHHAFYQHLAGKPATNQNEMLRYGAALAYATKASLIAAVVFAYRQQIWATFRRKSLKMTTIDNLFAAVDDLSALFSLDMARMAKSALALAIMCWLFPLVVILTPATLTVAPLSESQNARCPSVRTLNFDAEKTKNWRRRVTINGLPELSLSFWNSTMNMSSAVTDPFNETFFDYYTSPSPQVDLVATLSAYVKKVMPRANASVEICGGGWNCTYSINFVGPGYKCDLVAKGRNDNSDILTNLRAPFNTNYLTPDGNYSYVAHTSGGDYSSMQLKDVAAGGAPIMVPPFPKHLGAFRTEPVLWIGYSELVDDKNRIPTTRDDPLFTNAFLPKVYRCEHYVTNYTVQFNHTLAQQFTNVTKREFLYPIINTTYIPNVDSNDGTNDNATATPDSNFIYPLDTEKYRLTAAYHTMGFLMRSHINGTISWTPNVANTGALKTRLIDPRTYLVVPNFIEQVQSFYEDIILSMFSNPQFLVVAWAADPKQPSGTGNATMENLLYPCTRTRLMNKFVYKTRDLWLVYSVAIVCATIGVAFGAAAIAQNNHHVRTTRFSSIVADTRAPCMNELPWKVSKWGEVPDSVYTASLGHGIIVDEGGSPDPQTPGLSPGEGNARIYYGFAPEHRLAKSELALTSKKRAASVLSFRNWN